MPPSHFMINALQYLAQQHRSSHRAATEHERPRSAGAAPTATGRARAGRARRHRLAMIAIALLVAGLVGPIAAKAGPGPISASRHASATSMARDGDPAAAPGGDDWWLVALVGGGVLAAVAVTSRACARRDTAGGGLGRSSAVPRHDSAFAGAPLLAAARLLRDPKIRIESPLDDLTYLMLDQQPLSEPDPTRAYWAAQAVLDLRASRRW